MVWCVDEVDHLALVVHGMNWWLANVYYAIYTRGEAAGAPEEKSRSLCLFAGIVKILSL